MPARKTYSTPRRALVLLSALVSTLAIVVGQTPAPANRTNQADAQDEVVRVDTNLVTVAASVMDRDGRYITDLKKEDFQIFEDGVEQQVSFFAPVEQPFTIFFLLDTSPSMAYRIGDLADAATTFLNQLRPDDRLIAVSFNDRLKVLCETTNVAEVREGAKLRLRSGGNYTALYYAVDCALKRMKKLRGRKAIVLFSDGYDSGSPYPSYPLSQLRIISGTRKSKIP
jgi:Ca-activated chloride channel homolog